MYEDVVLPVDRGKESNVAAIDETLDFIDPETGVIRLVFVWESEKDKQISDAQESKYPEPIQHAREYITTSPVDVSVTCATKTGEVTSEICTYAAENDVDVIAMATYGRSRVKQLLLGSTTESVIKASDVPVLVVDRK